MKSWRIILLFTIIGLVAGVGVIGVGYVRGEMAREYRITSSIAIVAQDKDGNFSGLTQIPYKTDVDFARDLTEDALYIIKSYDNMRKVVDETGLQNISPGSVSGNLSLSRYEDTEIIEMTLLWRSEKEGLEIMNAINKVSDSSLIDAVQMGRIHVINEPRASFIVGGNISISTWIYAALAGLAAGIAFCVLKFILSATIINGIDLEDIFGLDLLAILPLDKKYARAKLPLSDDIPLRDDIKSLTHMLINRMQLAKINKLYFTSAAHKEGRTGLVANVAIHLAELGKKTLLIDCDLKNPQLGALFNNDLKYEQTLNALYRGDSDKLDAVLRINGCLDLLPVILEKAPENFNDDMLKAVSAVMEDYDYVLIDAAPVGVDAEVLRLNEITDAVVFIVRCDFTTVDNIKKALRRLAKSGIPAIGGVFNASTTWKDAFKRTRKSMEKLEKTVNKKPSKKKKKKKGEDEQFEEFQ